MTNDGSAGSPQADDKEISNLGFRVSDLNRASLKFEIRNSKSEIASLSTLNSPLSAYPEPLP